MTTQVFSISKSAPARRLVSAQFLSQVCDRLMLVAMVWVITSSYDPKYVPWFVGLGALPHLLLAAVSPRLIGRLGALRTVVASDVVRGVALLLAVPFVSSPGTSSLGLLFILNFVVNFFGAFFNPAILVLPTRVVEGDLARQRLAAGVESCMSLASVLAPMLSVGLYAAFGLRGVVAANAASYLVAAALECRIPELPADASVESTAQRSPTLSAIHRREPLVPYLLMGFLLLNLLLGPVLVFIPLYARHVYGAGFSSVGALETALGIGTAAGSVLCTGLPGLAKPLRTIGALLAADCLAYVIFALSGTTLVGTISLLVLGAVLAPANIFILGLFQRRALPTEISTVMSWVNLISVATLPLSMVVVGAWLGQGEPGLVRSIALGCSLSSVALLGILVALPTLFDVPRGVFTRAVKEALP